MAQDIDIRQCLWHAGPMTTASTSTPIIATTVAGALACCSPVTGVALSAQEAEQLAALLKAMAEPTRLRLLSLVAAHEGGEACVCDLTEPVGLSQPTVSHHLKILVDAGLLTREKRGVWAYYRLVPERLHQAAQALSPGQ
jgi:ArsR family transcriptional regulator, arsenate/arsenite/antimonite-responsive transcriptional repressor